MEAFQFKLINNKEVYISDYYGNDANITIPTEADGKRVTQVGGAVFSYNDNITSIIIPSGITLIDEYAFTDCSNLISVTLPNTLTTIGEVTFNGCVSLASIVIPNSVEKIGSYAFSYCTNLSSVTIPNSVTKIGHGAFNECPNLIIRCNPDSYVERWAHDNGFKTKYIMSRLKQLLDNTYSMQQDNLPISERGDVIDL